MKKKLLIYLSASLCSIACSIMENESPTQDGEAQISINLTSDNSSVALVSAYPNTKSVSPATEALVENFSVYVFDSSSGKLETMGSEADVQGETATVNLNCKTGSKKIAAIVNLDSATPQFSTYESMKSQKLLFDPSQTSSLIMEGEDDISVSNSTTVELSVKHAYSKLVIESISNMLAVPQYRNRNMTISSIYLINAVGDKPLLGNYTVSDNISQWLNFKSNIYTENNLLFESLQTNLAYGQTHNTPHSLYCMPNPITSELDTSAPTNAARCTRLIVEVLFEGDSSPLYYPITLPSLQQNKKYIIKHLTITQPGFSNPDEPNTQSKIITFNLSVQDWEDGGSINDFVI